MNKLIVIISFLILFISGYSCKKVLYGEGKTRVKGQVIDKFSGDPIPDAWVELLAASDGSWYAPGIIDSFPTDHEGKFDFTFDAQKGIDYSVRGSYFELYDNYGDLEIDLKDGWSNRNLELELHPYAWIKAKYINLPPIDTVDLVHCNSLQNHPPSIKNVIQDTFQIGHILSNKLDKLTFFIVKNQNEQALEIEVNVPPLDTLDIIINY